MDFQQKSLQSVWEYIKNDKDENRFIARVFFINDLSTYYTFINKLADQADITVRLSEEKYCKGADTVPDLKSLIAFLDDNKEKDILIPHIAEYLRVGEVTERKASCLYSIINRHVHSKKRVWIPIFLAEGLFQSVVGPLDEERFGQYLVEIDTPPKDFSATAYATAFAKQKGIVDAIGIREWLKLWDDQKIKTGMSFSTRQIKQISPTNGDYSIKVVADPFNYIKDELIDDNPKLCKNLGTDEQWTSLIPYVSHKSTMEEIIPKALNMFRFDPNTIIGNWNSMKETDKWAFNLWYQLGLNKSSDYVSFAVSKTASYGNLIKSLECSIIDCQDNTFFDEWVMQRDIVLKKTGYHKPSTMFLEKFDKIADTRVKLKILTGKTHEERSKIIELISIAFRDGKTINDFKSLLQEKYPDLLLYLKPSNYLTGEVKEYFENYKYNKIEDVFSLELSNRSSNVNCLDFDTRGNILYSLKNTAASPYFLWFDGLGIEWIDMLMSKIKGIDSSISLLNKEGSYIGTAVLPTITKVNMEKADSETISEKKIDDLDTLSHIKDKSDCNYYSIIAKQFELIDKIAHKIVDTIKSHPEQEVIVTADHGMSRAAAKGFHFTQGYDVPAKATPLNHGRYCELPSEDVKASVTNTIRDGKILAFKTHNHFTFSGYAPGEIHGGASPEELLVPVLHFSKAKKTASTPKTVNYSVVSSEVNLGLDGNATVLISTDEIADSLVVDYNGKIIEGKTNDGRLWSVIISGLIAGNSYTIHVYPNNLFTTSEETIVVKRKGLIVDDDL